MLGLRVVGFIWVRLVDSSAPWVSFGRALGVVSFIRARPGGHRVHSGSLGSFRRAHGNVVFI